MWCVHLQNESLTQENAPPVYTVCHRQNILRPKNKGWKERRKKINSLCCPRGTCLWSQCTKRNKGLTSETYRRNKMTTTKMNVTILQTFIPGLRSNQKCTAQVGIRPKKLISGRPICLCECKAFVLSLFMQTDSNTWLLPMHVISRALWHTTMPPLLPKY